MTIKNLRIEGQLVVVVGGCEGLGLALAVQYVRQGAHTVIIAKEEEHSDEARILLDCHRRNAIQIIASIIADCQEANLIKKAVLHYGVPDILVVFSECTLSKQFADLTPSEVASQISHHYLAAFNVIHPVYQAMLTRSRTIRLLRRTRVVIVNALVFSNPLSSFSNFAPIRGALKALADLVRQEALVNPCLRESLRAHYVCSLVQHSSLSGHEEPAKQPSKPMREDENRGPVLAQVAQAILEALQREKFSISINQNDYTSATIMPTPLYKGLLNRFTSVRRASKHGHSILRSENVNVIDVVGKTKE